MSPAKSLDDQYDNLYDGLNKSQLDIALLQRDIQQIKEQINDIKEDIKSIKGYFVKTLIGMGSIVGIYFLQWILGGGLGHVISAIQPT